jgi:hypothetical protein
MLLKIIARRKISTSFGIIYPQMSSVLIPLRENLNRSIIKGKKDFRRAKTKKIYHPLIYKVLKDNLSKIRN